MSVMIECRQARDAAVEAIAELSGQLGYPSKVLEIRSRLDNLSQLRGGPGS
ncbi:hypothetical protein D3C74_85030 [compost metagenome]